jgi:hypothetical protein
MSGARQNRIERFRKATGGSAWLITSLRAAGEHRPCDAIAIANWRQREAATRPTCLACRQAFTAARRPQAFLTATSSRSPQAGVAVAAICECWAVLTPEEIEEACAAVLRRNLTGPSGRFLS